MSLCEFHAVSFSDMWCVRACVCVCAESLVMGKLHREIAMFLMQCCSEDQHKTNRQCVEVTFHVFVFVLVPNTYHVLSQTSSWSGSLSMYLLLYPLLNCQPSGCHRQDLECTAWQWRFSIIHQLVPSSSDDFSVPVMLLALQWTLN